MMKEGKYEFENTLDGYRVFYRRQLLGEVVGMREASGRHCFYLAIDPKREPRTYRGKVKAADALHAIYRIREKAKKSRWSLDVTILHAWDEKPSSSTN